MKNTLVVMAVLMAFSASAVAEDIAAVRSGMYAAKLSKTGGPFEGNSHLSRLLDAAYRVDVSTRVGHILRLSVWARGDSGNSTLGLRMSWYNPFEKLSMSSSVIGVPSPEWKEYAIDKEVRTDAVTVDIVLRAMEETGSFVLDDVRLLDLGPAGAPWGTPEELTVSNPGFEDWPGAADTAPADWRHTVWQGGEGAIERVERPPDTPTPSTSAGGWQEYN